MNIKDYITSGKLELYVLDRLEPAEMREVEAMAAEHPEVKAEIEQIEFALEGLANVLAPDVDPSILERLLVAIAPAPSTLAPEKSKAPKVPAEKTSRSMMSSFLPWLLALGGFLGSLYFYNQTGQRENELKTLQSEYDKLERDCDEGQRILKSTQQFIDELTNPATQDIILASADGTHDRSAIVFYNTATQKTLFRATNLPAPPSGKQYQLWAIDADGPKDLGVLATNLSGDAVLEVDYLTDVAAFAITLEDEGGKPTPDLSQLQVIGNVG